MKCKGHLFIVGMNDSGTTWLQNILSHCRDCVSFKTGKHPNGLEGQGAVWYKHNKKNFYPRDIDHKVVKVFTEKREIWEENKHFNWGKIKEAWNHFWTNGNDCKNSDPKKRWLLEKTPFNVLMVHHLLREFPDARFLIIHRNPYAICEGIRRTCRKKKKIDYALDRCATHWVKCSEKQIENIKLLVPDQAIWFKYEDMVTHPGTIQKQIIDFLPELHDLDLRKAAICHSMDGNKRQPVTNYNDRHLNNLSAEDYAVINTVLDKHTNLMEYFGYVRRTEPPNSAGV